MHHSNGSNKAHTSTSHVLDDISVVLMYLVSPLNVRIYQAVILKQADSGVLVQRQYNRCSPQTEADNSIKSSAYITQAAQVRLK